MTFNPLNLSTFLGSRFSLGFDLLRAEAHVCSFVCVRAVVPAAHTRANVSEV